MVRRPYRLGRRAEATEDTKQRIVAVAEELIAAAGFRPVTVEEVAERAGTSRPTVYRHFGSKQGLFEAVVWNMMGRAGLARLDDARHLPDVTTALRSFLFENCRLFTELGGALHATIDAARSEPEVARLLEATYYGRRIESLRHLATRLHDEGRLRPGWTIEEVVDALTALTSAEVFESLTRWRGRSVDEAAERLFAMTAAFRRS